MAIIEPQREVEIRYVYLQSAASGPNEEQERTIATLRREIAGLKQEVFRLRKKQFTKR